MPILIKNGIVCKFFAMSLNDSESRFPLIGVVFPFVDLWQANYELIQMAPDVHYFLQQASWPKFGPGNHSEFWKLRLIKLKHCMKLRRDFVRPRA